MGMYRVALALGIVVVFVFGVTVTAMPRRLKPLNGVWLEPQPFRALWADVFPDSEYVVRR
jgi:hypothetical protein